LVDLEFNGEKNGLDNENVTNIDESTTSRKKKRGRKKSKKNVDNANISNIYKYS